MGGVSGALSTFLTGSGLGYYPKKQIELDRVVYASNPNRVRGQGMAEFKDSLCYKVRPFLKKKT